MTSKYLHLTLLDFIKIEIYSLSVKNPCGFLKEIGETIFQKVDLKIKKKLKSPVKNPPPKSHTHTDFSNKRP